jgi:LuxR family maltose regulon positive regulatory protein
MPRVPLHALIWSQDHSRYDLYTQGELSQYFRLEDRDAWLSWLHDAASFAFQGVSGRLNVYLEERLRGGQYWYAYHTVDNRTRKRYLGRTASVTFALLEEVAKALGSESSPTPHAPEHGPDERDAASPGEVFYGMEVLSTKLSHPLLPSRLLARERLLHRLDQVCFYRLTLLSASAGWGKTTLLSTWAFRSTLPIAWLSLDELDNDPTRFWVSVLAALRTCLPGVGETALSMLRVPQPPSLTTILTTLLNDLSAQQASTVLLLDDYHLIDEQAIHDSLLFVLDHLPAHLHLVLSSRIDPPLVLSRWRARGQLLELRDADLHFQEEEAAQFLTHTMDLSLEAEEIAKLALRTEGWIAGLQLAALALQQREDRSAFVREFTGGHRYVLDYVQEEILARLPARLRDFLLHISILNRVSASLCQAVTTESESSGLLETIERANLFLVPLDEERRWYRVHDLFREALLARLHATQPALVPLLHRRAACWYEGQGEWHEAISHALAAADFSFAARLMEQTAEQFWLRGEARTICHWVMALPDAVVREHAHFVLTAALYLLYGSFNIVRVQQVRVRKEVEQIIVRVETACLHRKEQTRSSTDNVLSDAYSATLPEGLMAEQALLHQRLRLLRLFIRSLEAMDIGDFELLSSIQREIEHQDREDEGIWLMIELSLTFILHYTVRQEGALLVPRLQDAKQRMSLSKNRFVTIKVTQWLAMASVEAGQLHQAHQECLAGLDLLEQFVGYALLAGYFYMALAIVFYEWNQLEEVRCVLRKMIHDAAAWQQVDLHVFGYRHLFSVELAAGDLAAAHLALQEAEHLALHQGYALQRAWLTDMRVRWWLAQGNLSEASDWAAHVVFPQGAWEPHFYDELPTLIHIYFAQHQWTRALETLERFSTYFDRPGIISWTTTSYLSLYAVALYQTGKMEQARATAIRLFTLTEPGGFIRLYLDAGDPMRRLLQSLLDVPQNSEQRVSAVARSYVLTLLKAFEQEQRQEQREETAPTLARQIQGLQNIAHSSLIGPLSPQEQRVLQSMCAGRSNREIAGEFVVSINTVKAHVKKIYSKLQVRNRIEACQVARALRLFFEKTLGTSQPQSTL